MDVVQAIILLFLVANSVLRGILRSGVKGTEILDTITRSYGREGVA